MASIQDIMSVLSGGKMPTGGIGPTGKPSFIGGSPKKVSDADLEVYISLASEKHGIPKSYIRAIIERENSGHYANIKNPKSSATGMMQLIDSTARSLGVSDPTDPLQNIMGGTVYLKQQLDTFGDFDKAVAAYFQGPQAIQSKVDTGQGFGGLRDATGTTTEDYLSGVKESLTKYQQVYGEEGYQPGPIGKKSDIRERVSGILASGGQKAPVKTGMSVDEITQLLSGQQNTLQQPEAPQGQGIGQKPAEIQQPAVEPVAQEPMKKQGPWSGTIKEAYKTFIRNVLLPADWAANRDVRVAMEEAAEKEYELYELKNNNASEKDIKKKEQQWNKARDVLDRNSKALSVVKTTREQVLKPEEVERLKGVGGFAQDVAGAGVQLAGQFAAAISGGGPLAAYTISSQIGGSTIETLKEFGIEEKESIPLAALNVAIQYPLEKIGMGAIGKTILKSAVPVIRKIIKASVTEGTTEGIQQIPDDVLGQMWGESQGKNLGERVKYFVDNISRILKDAGYAGLIGLVTGGGAAGVGHGGSKILPQEVKDADNIRRDQGQLREEGNGVRQGTGEGGGKIQPIASGETKLAEVKQQAAQVDEDLQKKRQEQLENLRLEKEGDIRLKAFNEDRTEDEIKHELNNQKIEKLKAANQIFDEQRGQYVSVERGRSEEYWSAFGRIGYGNTQEIEGMVEPSPFQRSSQGPRGTPPGTPPTEQVVKETKKVAGTEQVVEYQGKEVSVDDQGRFYPADQQEITERVAKVVMEAGGKIPPKGVVYPGQVHPETGEVLEEPKLMYNLNDGSTKLLPLTASDKEIKAAIEKGNKPQEEKKTEGKSVGKMGLHVIKYPSGRYGYVGSVPSDLAYIDATPKQLEDAKFGERFGPKKRSFNTEQEAIEFAKSKGFIIEAKEKPVEPQPNEPINVEEEKGKEKADALLKSGEPSKGAAPKRFVIAGAGKTRVRIPVKESEDFTLEGIPDKFFIVKEKIGKEDWYKIYHDETGVKVSDGITKEAAISDINEKLKTFGAEKFNKAVENARGIVKETVEETDENVINEYWKTGTHPQVFREFTKALEKNDIETIKKWVENPSNKTVRKMFEDRTGIKLNKGAKATRQIVDEWAKTEIKMPKQTRKKYSSELYGKIFDAITMEYGKNQAPGFRTKLKVFVDTNHPTDKELVDYSIKHFPRVKDRLPSYSDVIGTKTPEQTRKEEDEYYNKLVEKSEEKRTPNERLIYDLTERLQQGKSFKNTRELLDVADEIHGGTVAEGKYGIRDAYDALETAMNRHIEADGVSGDPKAVITRLNELIARLPTQTVRTKEQTELQQFSTPPSEAYLTAKLTGIKKGMKALEPSAGTGNIATMMRSLGGDVHVNEIAEGRQANLKAIGFEPTGVDAEYLNSTLPEDIQVDVVGMNPPFSSTGGRLTHHDTGFGAEHVRQALLRVKPGGRLVAIVGKGMAFGKPKMASWWNQVMKKYSVRANVGISGKEYTKYGTGFDNNIIVIDNTGPTKMIGGLPVGAITGQDLTVEQAYDKMKSLIEEDVHGRIKESEKVGTVETSKGVSTGGKKVSGVGTGVSTPGGRGRGTEAGKRGEPGPAGVDEVRGDQVEKPEGTGIPVSTDIGEGKPEGGEPGRPGGGEPGYVGPGQPRSVTSGVQHVQLSKEEGGAVEEESGGVYAKYKVRKAIYAGSKTHPAKISESVVMASVESPDVTYKIHLPESMIKTGIPSDVQLEAITYACQAHEQKNIDGSRKEFLLGDGTGTGKMITILGIIADNFRQGRKKAVIISKKRDLVNQMKGDMEKMGLKYPVIEQGKYKATEEIGENEGILFTTYGTASGDWSKTKPRYNQIINWLGEDFDGVVVFDESHFMKNVSESQFQGEEGDIKNLQEGTNSGQMGVAFKSKLKNARFVNASATAATTPTNLGYLTRMGLWGEGTPFKDFIAFLNVMRDGGIGAMELLARDMKASGQYLSRSISYDGISYSTVKHELTESETATYDQMADFWSDMLASMEEAAKNAGMKKAGQNIMKQFYATQQRFFLQLMTSFKTESMLKYADEEIAKGNSPVISLYSTGEAATTRAVDEARANGDDLDLIELSPKQMMADMVEKQFPIYQYEDYEENGQKGTRQVLDAAGNPLINKENYELRQAMIERIKNLRMPENPLDKIVNHFGEGKIAEITGRKRRMMIDITGRKTYKERAIKGISQNKINEHERNAFQSGQKIAAVISGAGSTGLDFHAAKNVKNQRRRIFISLQLSWSADQSQQAEGRVHRSNQVSAPHIALTATNIASEQRLVNANQKRLASMGGITKGGRETLTHGSMKAEDITDEYGKAALAWLYKQLPRATLKRMNLLNKEGTLKPNAEGNVDGFLNRIMVLRVADQNEIFDQFYKRYEDIVEAAKVAGTYDVGVEKLRGENIKIVGEPLVVHTDKSSGVETRLITLEAMRPVNREEFDDRMEKLGGDGFAVIQSNSKKYYLAKIRDNGDVDVYGPRGHHERFDTRSEFRNKYEEIGDEFIKDAKKGWNEELKKVPEKEAHKTTIVTGSIFPVYDKLFFGEERRRVVKRAVLENGESYIGIEIPSKNIPKIKQNFGIGSKLYEATPQELLDLIHGGSIIELDNSWKITERKVQGQKRIEIETEHAPSEAEMDRAGVFSETIQWTNRYFIPTEEEKALESIGKLIELHRPVRDLSAGQVEAAAAFEKKPPKYTEAEYAAPVAPDAENVKPVDMVRDIQGDKTITEKLSFIDASRKTGEHISWNAKGKKNNTDFLNRADKFYTDWKELAFPIQKVQDIAQKEGIPIHDAENIDFAIDQVRGSPARAKQWIDDNMKPIFDAIPSKLNGKKVSRGAVYAEAVKYMVARRSKDLYENEEKGYVDGGYDKATADKMVDFVEIGAHPWAKEIQRVAEGLWKVGKDLRQMKLDAGIIDDELFDALTEEHYVPFFRDIGKPSKVSKGGGDRFTATSKGIMRIKGSLKGSAIIDPVQGIIQQVYETIQNVAKAKVANTLVDLAERSGMAVEEELKALDKEFKKEAITEAVYKSRREAINNKHPLGELIKELPAKWIKAGTIEHRGAVDMVLRPQIEDLAKELGIKVEYTAKLAGHVGGRMTKLLGLFTEDRIKALVGATEGTVAHELGHGIHNSGRYQWIEDIADRNVNEMNLIADSRYQGEEVPVKYVTYVRSTKEKVAEFVSMYLTDRAMLQEMAPNSVRELEAKIKDDPIMKKMIDMKPSNVAGIHSIEVANFVRDRSIPRDEDVISVLRGGNIKSYRVPLEVAVAIKNLNPSMFPAWFRVLMLPTQIVRAGAVGLNIDFMIPNVFRDQMDAAINAKTIPFVDFMLGMKSYISHDEIYRQYNLMGGGMESAEAGITGGKAKASELQFGGKSFIDPYYWQTYGVFHGLTQATWYGLKAPFKVLYGIAELSEMSSRLGTFRRAQKGFKPLGTKPVSTEQAIHIARQATLDFQRFGKYGKGANETIPLINAGFEGIDKMGRTFKDDPKRAILKAMVYAILPMIGFYLWNRKDERYKAVPLKDKIINWIIMKPEGGYWKIPKGHITRWVVNPIQIPFEIAMGHIIDDNKPRVVYQVVRDLSPVDYNSLIPPTIKLIVEPIVNYDLYWQTEIEKPSIRGIPIPGLRWNAQTSGALKYIGKALNISPIMMQHELESLGAGFAKNILWAADMISGRYTREEMKIQDIPIARRFVGQLNEWNTDIDRNIRDINKQLSNMTEISMRKMIKSYGHTPADIQELQKRNSEFRYKLERKRYELMKAKEEIKYLLSKGK